MSIIFGYLAANTLIVFALAAAADSVRAGRRKAAKEAAEDAEHEAYWAPIRPVFAEPETRAAA